MHTSLLLIWPNIGPACQAFHELLNELVVSKYGVVKERRQKEKKKTVSVCVCGRV